MTEQRVARARVGAWLLAPAVVLYVSAFLLPLTVIAFYSLGHKPPFESGQSIAFDHLSLDNYRRAMSGTFLSIFLASMRTAAIGTAACFFIGFPVAYWLATRCPPRWRSAVLAMLVLPSWTSFLLRTFAWRILLSGNGPLSRTLQAVSVIDGPLQVLDTRLAVQLGVVYNYLPLMILPLYVVLERQDPRLREASQDLGASAFATFRAITWPLVRPGAVAGSMLVFIPLAGEYVTPAILGGAKGMMAGSVIASQFLDAQDWALGAAQAVLLVVAIAFAAMTARLVASRAGARRTEETA